jgi:hypothetical protein
MLQIFVVMGGWEYEGCDSQSVKLFFDEPSAEEEGKRLVDEEKYDFYNIVECPVEGNVGDEAQKV